MGLTSLGMIPTGMMVRIVEWEVSINRSNLAPKLMIECIERVDWSMAKSKPGPKEERSIS